MTEQGVHISKPTKLNRDAAPKYLPPDSAFYMLNNERSVNADGSLGTDRPLISNELLCQMSGMIEDPFSVGAYFSDITNETYFFFLNPNVGGFNYILRVNQDSTCELVYQGECLFLSAAPEHTIFDWRCFMKYDKICAHRHGKQLVWVDGSDNPIGMLDVEASIATNNFTTAFFERCQDACAPLQMCVPELCGALKGEFITLSPDEIDLNNTIIDKGIQVIFRHIYYDGRASEWGDVSSLDFLDAKGCFDDSDGLPRCIKYRIPIGNPLVDKIQFAFNINNGFGETGTLWFLADTIEKYQPYTSEGQYWYERELADLLNYSDTDCSFDYIFCNDKDCAAIDPKETARIFNPMPRAPQGLIRIKDSLGFYNYIKGNCPISEAETKKITVSLDCADIPQCADEFVNVTVRAIIHNTNFNYNQFIYRFGGVPGQTNTPDDKSDPAYFGGIIPNDIHPDGGYGQIFSGQTRDFIVYVEGTDISAEMVQKNADANFVNILGAGTISSIASVGNLNDRTGFFFQEAVLKVKKGARGFLRLVNHKQTTGIGLSQNTSEQVIGLLSTLTTYNGKKNITSDISQVKEIYFDTCDVTDGELIMEYAFVISDLNSTNTTGNHSSTAYDGYITDNGNKPVEGALVRFDGNTYARTDHNGYYFFYLYGSPNTDDAIDLEILAEQDCGAFSLIKTVGVDGSYNTKVTNNIKITDTDDFYYEDTNLEVVKISVTDCDSNPVAGIRVAISGSKYKITDAGGIATFKLRNYYTRNRVIKAVVMNNNYCLNLACDGSCSPCMPATTDVALPACFTGGTTSASVVGHINVSSESIGRKGLKAGGGYDWQAVLQGSCGRLSAAYPITVLDGSIPTGSFMNIPKTQTKTGLSFCGLNYNVHGFVPPIWADCLKIVRSKNQNDFVLQWIVDKIERTIDNKIILTIQSLNDYNTKYNFETNTFYEYLKGDRVEFISNGDGSIFDVATFGLLNYQILNPFHDINLSGLDAEAEFADGVKFFNQLLIEDDGKLDGLTEGAKIEIDRPKDCTNANTPYFEIALSLSIVNISGVQTVLNPSGVFVTFDTYFVNRQIGNRAPQIFESKNPSDFWGDKLNGISDIGKVHFANKYENEARYGRNITINTINQFNRFGDFEKTLDAPEQGDLIAIGIYDGKIGLGIGQNDNFLFQISNEFLQVGTNGIVRAAPVDSIIGETEPKIAGIFGCQYEDAGSIFFGDGYVTWIEAKKNAHVKHDFNIAVDMALGYMKSWFTSKIQRVKALNAVSGYDENKYRWITGINNETNAVQLSIKALTDADINNSQDALLSDFETLLYDPASKEYLTFAAYVQECYINAFTTSDKGCAFLSVSKGNVYTHPVIPTDYNTFNGVCTDWVIGIVVNTDPKKIKMPLAIEVQSETSFFVSKVETDKVGFLSEIPAVRFEQTERKWNGAFLYNKNARGGLYGTDEIVPGESARGYWIKVTFIRDNTLNLAYNTIDANKQKALSNVDMFLVKYMISESSGFTTNL